MRWNSIRAACAATVFAAFAFSSINPAAALNAAECSVSGGTWSPLSASATSGFCLQANAKWGDNTGPLIQLAAESGSERRSQKVVKPGSGKQKRLKHHRRSIYTGTGCPPACKR